VPFIEVPVSETASAPTLAEVLSAQDWLNSQIEQDHPGITQAIFRALSNARASGRPASDVVSVLEAVGGADWVGDGLSNFEGHALAILLSAYGDALSRFNDRDFRHDFVEVISHRLFEFVDLPESGRRLILATGGNDADSRAAISAVRRLLPRVEELLGPYPHSYVFVSVHESLAQGQEAISREQFLEVARTGIDNESLARELSRATISGSYGYWYREGILDLAAAIVLEQTSTAYENAVATLEQAGADKRADLSFKGLDYKPTAVERAQVLLVMLGFREWIGVAGIGRTTRLFKGDYEIDVTLLNSLVEQAYTPDQRAGLTRFLCTSLSPGSPSQRRFCSP
jgi:hypothetical protein